MFDIHYASFYVIHPHFVHVSPNLLILYTGDLFNQKYKFRNINICGVVYEYLV